MSLLIKEFQDKKIKEINDLRKDSIFETQFIAGDTLEVKYKITEGENTRIQAFKGVVIAKTKNINNYSSTFTLRKITDSISVERKFIFFSPMIASIKILKRGVVNRAKLYYLRKLTGKSARIKEKIITK